MPVAGLDRLSLTEQHTSNELGIGWIAIPTCNRVAVLERCLISYVENLIDHCREPQFIIADDSPQHGMRASCKDVLCRLTKKYPLRFWYAGLEEKVKFAKRLIETSTVPPHVIKFALFDSNRLGIPTYGANRNCLLLQTLGSLVVSVDDDTLCRIARAPGFRSEISVVSEEQFSTAYPCNVWIYRNRDDLLQSVEFVQTDLLSIHERLLGRAVSDSLLANCLGNRPAPRASTASADEPRRVLVTWNGIAGDCAWPSPSGYLMLVGESFDRLTLSDATYAKARISREILRVVSQPTISDESTNCPGLFTGLDNREFLPPYFPVGRGEDISYWKILKNCISNACYGFLPWALLHAPMEPRAFFPGEMSRGANGVALDVLLTIIFDSFSSEAGSRTEQIKNFGQYLQSLARIPSEKFLSIVNEQLQTRIEAFTSHLERRAGIFGSSRRGWNEDVTSYIATAKQAAKRPHACVPIDLRYGRDIASAQAVTQNLVRLFGELLQWWPELVVAVRGLQCEGVTIGKLIR